MSGKGVSATPTFSFVTVTHEAELPLLKLQARSLALFCDELDVSEVVVIVNDRNQEAVADQVRALQDDYGALRNKLKIVLPEQLLSGSTKGESFRSNLKDVIARNPWMAGVVRSGWQRNDGWRTQQMLKLLSYREVSADFVVFLDTKNLLIRPLCTKDLVEPDGRAKAGTETVSGFAIPWLEASLKVFDLPVENVDSRIVTSFVTPFPIATPLLAEVVDALEAKKGKLHHWMLRPTVKSTEFFLISAYCLSKFGGVGEKFSHDQLRPGSIFGGMSEDAVQDIFEDTLRLKSKFIGLHPRALKQITPRNANLVAEILSGAGLFDSPRDAHTWVKNTVEEL